VQLSEQLSEQQTVLWVRTMAPPMRVCSSGVRTRSVSFLIRRVFMASFHATREESGMGGAKAPSGYRGKGVAGPFRRDGTGCVDGGSPSIQPRLQAEPARSNGISLKCAHIRMPNPSWQWFFPVTRWSSPTTRQNALPTQENFPPSRVNGQGIY